MMNLLKKCGTIILKNIFFIVPFIGVIGFITFYGYERIDDRDTDSGLAFCFSAFAFGMAMLSIVRASKATKGEKNIDSDKPAKKTKFFKHFIISALTVLLCYWSIHLFKKVTTNIKRHPCNVYYCEAIDQYYQKAEYGYPKDAFSLLEEKNEVLKNALIKLEGDKKILDNFLKKTENLYCHYLVSMQLEGRIFFIDDQIEWLNDILSDREEISQMKPRPNQRLDYFEHAKKYEQKKSIEFSKQYRESLLSTISVALTDPSYEVCKK